MRELDVLTDRDRIARDLHDHVIQRLFAVGLALQGTIARTREDQVATRLTDSVDELQQVIQEIRTSIFDLRVGPPDATRLRQRLDDALAQCAGSQLHTSMRFSGPLSVVDTALAELAEAVVREGVSDAASRSATTLAVTVAVGDEVCIELVDDGPGAPAGLADGAIADLRSRTEDAGG